MHWSSIILFLSGLVTASVIGGRMTTSRTIKDYEELLHDHGFYRVHQRHIINLRHVKKYLKGDGGSVILSDETEIPVSS